MDKQKIPDSDVGGKSMLTGGLDLPRYSLRSFLVAIAVVGVCCGLLVNLPPVVVGTILFGATLVALHVVGNVLGMRLKDGKRIASSKVELETPTCERALIAASRDSTQHAVPATRLSQRHSLGWPMVLVTGVGVIASAYGSYCGMHYLYGDNLKSGAVAIGVVAASVLGGFWSFGTWSLTQVFLTAWWDAHSSASNDRRKPG
ncbi:MAG: hypothetical protein KDB27_01730 [Planctomycetales bacterium]|nr:hypothetical protein [Planctomycetales bacterium]